MACTRGQGNRSSYCVRRWWNRVRW
jgi:hypothetical protein